MALGDTTSFLSAVRRHTGIPSVHPSYTDALTLADATEDLHSYMLPLGMGERQELWAGPVGRSVLPIESGTARYPVSGRTIGAKLRAARLVGPNSETGYLNYYGREDVAHARDDSGMPTGLVMEGGTFRLFPTPRNLTGWTLEVDYYIRPGELIPTTQAAQLLTVSVGTGSTTITAIRTDANDAIFTAGYLDVVSVSAPFDTVALESAVVSVALVSGTTYEVVLDGELDVNPTDWLCLTGQSPMVQAPVEWHPLLACKVAVRQLTTLGDAEGAAAKGREMALLESRAATLVRPRREDVARTPQNGTDRWRRPVGFNAY